jgi:hypothetical protein
LVLPPLFDSKAFWYFATPIYGTATIALLFGLAYMKWQGAPELIATLYLSLLAFLFSVASDNRETLMAVWMWTWELIFLGLLVSLLLLVSLFQKSVPRSRKVALSLLSACMFMLASTIRYHPIHVPFFRQDVSEFVMMLRVEDLAKTLERYQAATNHYPNEICEITCQPPSAMCHDYLKEQLANVGEYGYQQLGSALCRNEKVFSYRISYLRTPKGFELRATPEHGWGYQPKHFLISEEGKVHWAYDRPATASDRILRP